MKLTTLILFLLTGLVHGQDFNTPLVDQFNATASAASTNTQWVTSITPGAARNNFTGMVGVGFTNAANVTIKSLSRYAISGNNQTHRVGIFSIVGATGTLITNITITASGVGWQESILNPPVVVGTTVAGSYYAILSEEVSAGDQWYDVGSITTTGSSVAINGVYIAGAWASSGTIGGSGGLNHAFADPNYGY